LISLRWEKTRVGVLKRQMKWINKYWGVGGKMLQVFLYTTKLRVKLGQGWLSSVDKKICRNAVVRWWGNGGDTKGSKKQPERKTKIREKLTGGNLKTLTKPKSLLRGNQTKKFGSP